jgi:D-alanyl-D-alanine carboxypeptidase
MPVNGVSWIFSITKTFTATLVMKLAEQGRIDLDERISMYLPENAAFSIKGSDQVTVRQLLQHSSGIADFTSLPVYQLAQLNNPVNQPSIVKILGYMEGQNLKSEAGAIFDYCNTNYLLATLILEKVTGKPYNDLLQEEIIAPLKLTHTYFHLSEEQLHRLGFPDYYFDRFANNQLENVSRWNNALGNACVGWGGIASTPADVLSFYQALMEGRVVSPASLQQMIDWFKGKNSEQPDYGLGIEYFQYAEGTTPQRGHEGDGIGNSTLVLYVPDNDTYLYVNITAGRKLYGPYLFKVTDCKNELAAYVAKWR